MANIDYLITNGTVITMDGGKKVLENGAVAILGSHIVAVGSTEELRARYQAAELINAEDQIVMPGLINAHTHNAMSLFRGLDDDEELESWLQNLWKVEHQIVSPEMVRIGSRLAYIEMIRGGTTMSVDMYWHPQAGAAAAREIGFRLMNGPIYVDFDNAPDGLALGDRLSQGRSYLQSLVDDPLIEPCVMPHSTYTVSPASLEDCFTLASEFDAMFITHASETLAEVAMVKEQHGRTPPKHLDQLGMLSEKTQLVHCVHLSDDEIEIFAERGVSIVHCPTSNLKVGAGIARVMDMRNAGVPVLLGTDGAASSNDLDLWKVIRLASLLQRGANLNPTFNPAPQALEMVTSQAAKVLGMGDRIGSLEVGKLADLIIIDLDQPHLVPLYDYYSQLVYAVGREDVNTVMINGNLLMRDRELLTVDEDLIISEARMLSERIRPLRR